MLNRKMFQFMGKEGIILGQGISQKGIEVDRPKVKAIKLPYAISIQSVRSFLGHAYFYWRFINNFYKIAHPLCKLLKKEV